MTDFSAVGGTKTVDGLYTVHRFAASGALFCTGTIEAETLVVAGGGAGGGKDYSGGGGAGGLVEHATLALSGSMAVTIGPGGTGVAGAKGNSGGDSAFGGMTALGGGGGGVYVGGLEGGAAGGSGGGGASNTGAGGASTQGNSGGGTGYGHSGGVGTGSGAAGGGGAGGTGATGISGVAAGGLGRSNDITGSAITYAVGGEGTGDGGANGHAGTTNRGNGGDGAGVPATAGGAGGSGIVVVRYLTPPRPPSTEPKRGYVIFTFDDFRASVYDNAFPMMTAAGLRGVCYLYGGNTSGPRLSEAQEMYAAGWDMGNHTVSHDHLLPLTQAEIQAEVADQSAALIAAGMPRAASHFAYPFGEYDGTTLAALRAEGILTARTTLTSLPDAVFDKADADLLQLHCVGTDHCTLAEAEAAADLAAQGHTVIYYSHEVVAADDPAYLGTGLVLSEYQELYSHVAGLDVNVVTMSEWYRLPSPLYAVEPLVPKLSLLCGTPALGYTDLPTASEKAWTHGQHGPASASFQLPCQPFAALDPRVRRDSRLFITQGAGCVWSGYLSPVSSAQSDGEFVTVDAAGTFERGKHDEGYVLTCTDSDESRWFLRKGSSQRFTIENDGTLVIRAEGGGTSEATNWKAGVKAEQVYYLDDGHSNPLTDPPDHITQLDFLWNMDMAAGWTAYIDAYTDAYDGVKIGSSLWSKTGTTATSGESVTVACPALCRAIVFGLKATVDNQIHNDVFVELSDMLVTASSGRVRIDEALALTAADLTDGTITTTPIGDKLDNLVWPLGSGSRSYSQEQTASLHNVPCDWRYVPPMAAPGEDSFIAREMPTAPENRQRWWFVSAKDPGVTVDLTYQDPEGMDIAGIMYGMIDGNLLDRPSPSPSTTVWPSEWTQSAGTPFVADAYNGFALKERSFVLEATDVSAESELSVQNVSGMGKSYRLSCVVERASATFNLAAVLSLLVQWYDSAGDPLSVDGPTATVAELPTQGAVAVLSQNVTAPAGAASANVLVYMETGAGSAAVAVRNIHFDTIAPGGTVAVAYYPAAPTSVDQRVRMFDYSSEQLSTPAARRVLEQAYAWYGVQASERDREPVGTIGVTDTIKTIDGAPGYPGQMQTGDWITVVDDIDHVAWPQFIVGVDVTDDGESASIQLGGDGGDFNYVGRVNPPAQQKRKRRAGHHRRVLWHTWARKNAQAAFRKQRKGKHGHKSFAAYMKANPLAKKHPKWGPG